VKKILWVGDGPDCQSGFGKATREIVASLDYRLGGQYDVTVLGINHRGDPGTVPYPVYTAAVGGDAFGVGRLIWMCNQVKPDVIVILQDGWNIPFYMQQLAQSAYKDVPVVAYLAVDGKNFNADWLKGIAQTIFWTDFAKREARLAFYDGLAQVIPLGVDLSTYYPTDKREARHARKIDVLGDAFIVGNVNRNQPRKRWDLTLRYFAEWVKSKKPQDVFLFLHTAPTGDVGVDVVRLAKYYGILEYIALMEPPTFYGITEAEMRDTYNCFDVQITTTQGEGFGFTTFEGMACGVPQIVPDWSALGELCKDAALMIPCTSTCVGSPFVNVIGGVADEEQFVEALDLLYRDHVTRARVASQGLARVHEERFRWSVIGQAWLQVLEKLLTPLEKAEAVWQDLGRPQDVV
jgi:D-inositol-3-phosphate glycosyltransferase